MNKAIKTSLAMFALLVTVSTVQAGDVTVKGVHLCCGACVKGVAKALGGVDGVSDASCDRPGKTVTFAAANDKAAQAGIDALAKAGFHGTATHGDKKVAFPASGVKKGAKADEVTFTNVHLCCGGCVNGAKKALADIATNFSADRGSNSVTLKGSDIDVAAAAAALNEAGFHATVKK